ncbi:MAG TPA: hypothetical protein VGC84_11970 [Ilumatobacteraceae bacterium]|jgi:hypothetical protein
MIDKSSRHRDDRNRARNQLLEQRPGTVESRSDGTRGVAQCAIPTQGNPLPIRLDTRFLRVNEVRAGKECVMNSDQTEQSSPSESSGDADARKPKSMRKADVANGESPDPVADEERERGKPTGSRQAAENQENDPPA